MDCIGIDLHKRDSQIYVLGNTGEVTECRIRTLPTESDWVAACLEELGHEVIVADPNYAAMYGQRTRRIKTNRRDAAALAEACRIGNYRPVHRVSAAQRRARQQLRVREALVATRTRVIAMTRALCRGEGIALRHGAAQHFRRRLAEVTLPAAMAETLAPVIMLLQQLEEQLAMADRAIIHHAAQQVDVRRLMTVPGVGPVIATAYVATLDTPTRFRRARQVASYLGLVPREASSAERRHRGHITKTGNPRIRWLLVQAAWTVWLSRHARAAPLRDWVTHVARRRGVRVGIVGLARRLAGILYAVWRDATVFDPRRLQSVA